MTFSKISITFLGTGTSSGVPMRACSCEVCRSSDTKDKRLRSSILVKSKTTTIVVDTTPDFRYQMLRYDVRQLDAVIFTHPHKDHLAGLDDIRAYNYFSGQPMEVYANLLTREAIRREFSYAFAEKTFPGIPKINLNTIEETSFTIGDMEIQPIRVSHLDMPVLGFRFGKFTYITDANYIDEKAMGQIAGSEIIVLNALRKEKHISHFSLSEAAEVSKILKIPQTYLTHISHQMGKHAFVNNELGQEIQLAYDGQVIEI